MPTLITARGTVFIHVPKTGGIWASAAMRQAGLQVERLDPVQAHVHQIRADAARFRFAFVRHPLSWWASYWRYRMDRGWAPGHRIDSRVQADDFDQFIENVVTRLPGFLSAQYRRFVGPPGDEIEFVGRFENLPDDLVTALRAAGEEFDEARLLRTRAKNTAQASHPAYRGDLEQALLESEREALGRFYDATAAQTTAEPREVGHAR